MMDLVRVFVAKFYIAIVSLCGCAMALYELLFFLIEQQRSFLFSNKKYSDTAKKKSQKPWITSLSLLTQMEPYFRGTVSPMMDEPYDAIQLEKRISKLKESMCNLHSLQMKLKVQSLS